MPPVNIRLPMDRPLLNTYWVLPERLLAGEYPGGSTEPETQLRLEKLRKSGIDSFVDLTELGELLPYQQFLPKDVDYLRSPIVDESVPYNVSQTQLVLAAINSGLQRGKRIYIHCRAGIGRTGLIIGCHLAEAESSGRTGLKMLNRLWQQSERSQSCPAVPQTAEQADYIRHWPKLGKRSA
jgi:hypothetical protein